MADPEENGGSRRNTILRKQKEIFTKTWVLNPKYNMIIEQEKNKRKTKINVYIALSHWSLLLALQNIKETAEIGKTTRGKREINYWGEKNKDEIDNWLFNVNNCCQKTKKTQLQHAEKKISSQPWI